MAGRDLAGNVKAVYQDASEIIKRGYNQAFFRRIKIRARWDDETGQMVVEVESVELTEPYAVLLAENTTDDAMAWVSAIRARKRPDGALSGDDVSIYIKLAGRPGRRANPASPLDRLIEALMEPVGRATRRRAVAAIRQADHERAPS